MSDINRNSPIKHLESPTKEVEPPTKRSKEEPSILSEQKCCYCDMTLIDGSGNKLGAIFRTTCSGPLCRKIHDPEHYRFATEENGTSKISCRWCETDHWIYINQHLYTNPKDLGFCRECVTYISERPPIVLRNNLVTLKKKYLKDFMILFSHEKRSRMIENMNEDLKEKTIERVQKHLKIKLFEKKEETKEFAKLIKDEVYRDLDEAIILKNVDINRNLAIEKFKTIIKRLRDEIDNKATGSFSKEELEEYNRKKVESDETIIDSLLNSWDNRYTTIEPELVCPIPTDLSMCEKVLSAVGEHSL